MLKVGLIGCGMMGAMHANCYKALDGVTLAADAPIEQATLTDAVASLKFLLKELSFKP